MQKKVRRSLQNRQEIMRIRQQQEKQILQMQVQTEIQKEINGFG
jgi:hypothetical protein